MVMVFRFAVIDDDDEDIPDIYHFWYTTLFFRPVKNTWKKWKKCIVCCFKLTQIYNQLLLGTLSLFSFTITNIIVGKNGETNPIHDDDYDDGENDD